MSSSAATYSGSGSREGFEAMLALCDVLLNPADNLQLAALLRSPLFDIGEDDLFALAQPRDRQTLWQALETCTAPDCAEAWQRLSRWRGSLDFERPFEFLTQILYAEGGLRRFHARLGEEVDEVFAELLELALKHEQGSQPSLQGFVAAMRQSEVSIKRELAEAGTGIRVMTVHGAKGLEAPIVILADAASKPQGNQVNRPVYLLTDAPGPLLVHASGRGAHVEGSQAVKAEVERCMRVGKPCPGFVMAVGNHIPVNIPMDNVLYYFDLVRAMGGR